MDIKKYTIDNREIHMMGDFVAVCWSLRSEKKSIIKDGITYSANIKVRKEEPYIDFITIWRYEDGENCISDDISIEGGLSVVTAKAVADEITKACDYIEGKKWLESEKENLKV